MIKHIFCDLDGTLYNNGISKEDIESIKIIEEKGVKFHIATGRTFNDVHSMINDCIKIDGYYICENGAFIHDKNHKLLFKGTIEDEIVNKVISRFESQNAYLYFKHDGIVILVDDDNILNKDNKYIVDKDFINRKKYNNLIGNIGVVSEDIEELSRIHLYLESEFGEVLDVYFSADNVINLVKKGVSKRTGIEYVCKILNLDMDEVATIGDSPNDINMLKGFKYSFAMNNARDSVKENANYITKSVSDAIKIIDNINLGAE
jgi:Cof subfamily protein (haloacid dehalogenase superfamily)